MPWRVCQTCHGKKVVQVEVKPGKWVEQPCGACNGQGGVHTEAI